MILKNSKVLLVTLSLIALALLSILALGVYNIRFKNKETSELLNLADHAAETGILIQSIRAAQNNSGQDIEAFDNLALAGDKIVPLIESIEGAGRALGLDTSILSVGKIEDKKSADPPIVRIVMETQGAWAPTLSFLRAIESLPYRVMIDESSLSKEEVGWRSRVILSLYSFD